LEKKNMKKFLLVILLISLAVSACTAEPGQGAPQDSDSLLGAWNLTAHGPVNAPVPAVEGVEAGLTFNEDGTVSGTSGCNGLGGDYSVEGNQITFGEFVSTLMACDDPIMAQEEVAHKVLTGTAIYAIEGDRLTITKDSNVLVLKRSEESIGMLEGSDLLGSWKLTSYGTTETQSPALPDVEAGLTFSEDGAVTGTSGCNEFGGAYSVDGNEIAFKEIVSTLILCDTPIMEQEEAMSQMLSDSTAYSIEGDTLSIVKNGMMLVLTRDSLSPAEPGEPSSLTGIWRLTSYGTGNTLSSALADVEANLMFNEDGTVTGTSGCNEFGGKYTIEADQLTFEEIVSTLMLCDTPLMGQEEAMQQVLTETATYQLEGDILTITNNDRVMVLTR
jgi:putative lipoprotein